MKYLDSSIYKINGLCDKSNSRQKRQPSNYNSIETNKKTGDCSQKCQMHSSYVGDSFSQSQCRTAIMFFLFKNRHCISNAVRLARMKEHIPYNKSTIREALIFLIQRGWIIHHKIDDNNTYICFNSRIPLDFLNIIRSAIAKAKGYDTWFDLMRSISMNEKPTNTNETYLRRDETQDKWPEKRRSNVRLDSKKVMGDEFADSVESDELLERNLPQKEVRSSITRGEVSNHEPKKQKKVKKLSRCARVKGVKHRYDPQGLPYNRIQRSKLLERSST